MTKKIKPGADLAAMRAAAPLVHCITNYVAMNIAANVLLAAGAAPAMVHCAQEAGEFATLSDALTVNIGTLSPDWVAGMLAASEAANAAGRPWVLDPVAYMATAYRRRTVAELLERKPAVIRANASEILALSGARTSAKGAEAKDPVSAAEDAARALAVRHACVVAVTGEIDFVTDGTRGARVAGGCALMPQVTALGSSLTCLVGAYVAVQPDVFRATISALAHFAVAGRRAERVAAGPGSFSVGFLDMLAALDEHTLDAKAEVVLL